MWMKGSSSACDSPAKARRTGKPSPSNPAGAVVTDRTGRSTELLGSGSATAGSARGFSTVMAGMAPPTTCERKYSVKRTPASPGQARSLRPMIRPARLADIEAMQRVGAAAGRRFAEIDDPRIAARADDAPLPTDALRRWVDAGRAWIAVADPAGRADPADPEGDDGDRGGEGGV